MDTIIRNYELTYEIKNTYYEENGNVIPIHYFIPDIPYEINLTKTNMDIELGGDFQIRYIIEIQLWYIIEITLNKCYYYQNCNWYEMELRKLK